MRKTLNKSKLSERPATSALLALTLSASLAAFGCTTNRTPGSGEPVTGGPPAGPTAPTSGATGGTSASMPGPMTSSYRGVDTAPEPLTRADRAAAIMSELEPQQGRVLGPANPGPANRSYSAPAMSTVSVGSPLANSTVPTPVFSGVADFTSASTPALVTAAASTTAAGTIAASTVVPSSGVSSAATPLPTTVIAPSPTEASMPVSPGMFATGSVAVTNPGVASGATVARTTATPTTVAAAPTTVTATDATTAANARVRELRTNVTTGGVRVLRSNGRVVVTNDGSNNNNR